MEDLKKNKMTKFQIIKLSISYFRALSKRSTHVVFFIVLITIFKNYLNFESDGIKLFLKNASTAKQLKIAFIKASIYNSLWYGMNFLTDYLFENNLREYGGYIATKALENLLYSDSKICYETSGSMLEYYVSEGGKAMAKICRFFIFAFLSKLCHFAFDFRTVFKLDDSENKILTKVFIAFLCFLGTFKLWKISKFIQLCKNNIDLAYQKEKSISETLENLSIIKAYGTSDHSLIKFRKRAYDWEVANISHKFWDLSTNMVYNSISTAVRPGMCMLFVLWCKENNSTAFSRNAYILNYMDKVSEILRTVNSFVSIQSDLIQTLGLTENVIEYLKLAKKEVETGIRVSSFSESIKVQNLTYTNKDKLIFSNVSFTINKGDKAALFGQNGTGKSSIFKILLGFDKYRGNIFFDGIEMSRICIEDFRRLITYVPQDTKLFDETIFYNLSYGNNKPFKEIVEECQKIGIHETIMSFPSGYNTSVGEGGHKINGGLRQKIFYTRAFLCDSEIYLFDEPTNNLDQNHGKFLLEYINDPKYTNKTFFVICHDKGIVSRFPKIYHFEEGQISEVDSL
ncbi:Iron-sulfur clusters transporter atm1 [Glugoides intestinalis]